MDSIYQKGIASIEFSLIFVILLALFYGIAGYAMPLLLSASYQQVASDALREGLAHHARHYAPTAVLQEHITEHIENNTWIPEGWMAPCAGSHYLSIDTGSGLWEACIMFPQGQYIIAPFPFFDWEFPQTPNIIGRASLNTREAVSLADI